MIDLILISDNKTGNMLFEFEGPEVKIHPDHRDIFAGFIHAIQILAEEIRMGNVIQISTEDHHCQLLKKPPITTISVLDCMDCVESGRALIEKIGDAFLAQYQDKYSANEVSRYEGFAGILKRILPPDGSCSLPEA